MSRLEQLKAAHKELTDAATAVWQARTAADITKRRIVMDNFDDFKPDSITITEVLERLRLKIADEVLKS